MKLLQFIVKNEIRLGILDRSGVIDVAETARKMGTAAPDMSSVLQNGVELLKPFMIDPIYYKRELRYAPCITNPQKILCAGLNYKEHVLECREVQSAPLAGPNGVAVEPEIFGVFGNALAAHGDNIIKTAAMSQLDYEAELVAVIGKTCKNATPAEAAKCIFGFTVGNDVSERIWQKAGSQWLLGKGGDGFAPIGPVLVTADELPPQKAEQLNISCRVNGEIRQHNNTKNMIRTPSELISRISRMMTLQPGDLIFTGTPGGVMMGVSAEKQVWLAPGDTVECEIEGIGILRNTVAAGI